MALKKRIALGIDFGTESVRALFVDIKGNELASATVKYKHGQITEKLPSNGKKLPVNYALQHPSDWINASASAVKSAVKKGDFDVGCVIGIGVDFTSCTMLPVKSDGTPLCLMKKYEKRALAWPKLWKHHGAVVQTDKINKVAKRRRESFLKRYGGGIGLEWFFPKVLETLEEAPEVYAGTDIFIEAGDWYVWQLVGGPVAELPRSTCQAGYKAMWSADDGYPSESFLKAVHPGLKDFVSEKMPGRMVAPGHLAGNLCSVMSKKMGLPEGIPVSAAIIDAHAGVPGAGAAGAGTMVMVMGTSSCQMLNCTTDRFVPGVAGVVKGGILPGYYGFETGQAAVGDAFDWLRRTLGCSDFDELTKKALALPPGAEGVLCMDWFNGCRTPLMDETLKGAFTGLSLSNGPEHMYRALLESSAFSIKWIMDLLKENSVPVKRFIATGGLPHHNPLLMQIYADVLGKSIIIHPCKYGPALGAAILGVLAAGSRASGMQTTSAVIRSMGTPKNGAAKTVLPDMKAHRIYADIYKRYRVLAKTLQRIK